MQPGLLYFFSLLPFHGQKDESIFPAAKDISINSPLQKLYTDKIILAKKRVNI